MLTRARAHTHALILSCCSDCQMQEWLFPNLNMREIKHTALENGVQLSSWETLHHCNYRNAGRVDRCGDQLTLSVQGYFWWCKTWTSHLSHVGAGIIVVFAVRRIFFLSLSVLWLNSSCGSCAKNPEFGPMSRFRRTAAMASVNGRPWQIIRYARRSAPERLTPMAQCTNTFPGKYIH